MSHRSGYIAIAGLPNAGKSTLLNRILGMRLSIVSEKPQTTRHKILGILNGKDWQAVFVDTPGWLESPRDRLQQALKHAAVSAAREEADLVVWVADAAPRPGEAELLKRLAAFNKPMVLALNKSDLAEAGPRLERAEAAFRAALPWDAVFRVSAREGAGVPGLVRHLLEKLPEGPEYFPKDQMTDRFERFFAAEIVREKIFEQFGEEVPHACAVELEAYEERAGQPDLIRALILVERDGQKAIILGKGGRAIRRLREAAQAEIRRFLGRAASLELWVKVRRDWRQDPDAVREFGYR